MKKIYASILCFAIVFTTQAQTVIISDNFDTYTAGNMLAATSPLWITWTGASTEDAQVSNAQSHSAPNSVYVIGNTGPTDLVLQFPTNYISGIYELNFKLLIAASKGAYFNLQGSTTPGVEWMLEAYFDNVGGGYINAGGPSTATFAYNTNLWNDIRILVDLSGDVATFYMNSTPVYTWAWSLASDGTGAPVSWGGMNLYAAAAAPGDAEYYVDDVVFSDVTPTGMKEDISLNGFRVYPNPAKENFEVVYSSFKNTGGSVQLVNAEGQTVFQETFEFTTGTNRINVSNAGLAPGMYLLRLLTDEKVLSEKFVVEK